MKAEKSDVKNTMQIHSQAKVEFNKPTEAQGGLFFFKQWGTWGSDGVKRSKHKNGKLIDGKVLQAMPV